MQLACHARHSTQRFDARALPTITANFRLQMERTRAEASAEQL
jgi:hypothetical protein